MNQELKKCLSYAYEVLAPYSQKYKVDFDRYLYSLSMLSKIPELKRKKVLDIGTGIGIMPVALRKLGVIANGLDRYIFPDANNAMFGLPHIEELKKIWAVENVQVFNNDIYENKLPETIGTPDVIISEATIEHLKDPKKFLERCHSLLSKDGYLLITTPNAATLIKRLRFLFGKSPNWPITEFFKDGENFTGHWREYTLSELVYMCETSGFEIIEAKNVNALAKFKSLKDFKKNLRALISLFAELIPGSREMNFVLCKKR